MLEFAAVIVRPIPNPNAVFGIDPLVWAGVILAGTYVGIILEKINRVLVGLLGAGLMMLSGCLTQEEALKGVDFNTLALLIGMMIIVGEARRTGVFQYLALAATKVAGGEPYKVMALLSIVTAVMSALRDNLTTALLIVPVTLVIAGQLKLPPYPFLIALMLSANIGGTATLIGYPPNMIIGSEADLTFNQFLTHLGPIAALILIVQIAINHWVWGREMKSTPEMKARAALLKPSETISDKRLLKLTGFVLALVILGFILQRTLKLEVGAIALVGAALLLLLDSMGRPIEDQDKLIGQAFAAVDWNLVFFLVGMFIIVAGAERSGLLAVLAKTILQWSGGNLKWTALGLLWSSALISAFFDNIPYVASMIPVIKAMAPTFGGAAKLQPLWWSLALGACLGGNGTLFGASVNLTVANFAERNGIEFRFFTFVKYAFPMMLVSVVLASLYVYLRYLM